MLSCMKWNKLKCLYALGCELSSTGADPEIFKKRVLNVGRLDMLVKKIASFRWFEKAEVTLETKSFWRNISISIFKFSPFL